MLRYFKMWNDKKWNRAGIEDHPNLIITSSIILKNLELPKSIPYNSHKSSNIGGSTLESITFERYKWTWEDRLETLMIWNHDYKLGNTIINLETSLFTWEYHCPRGNISIVMIFPSSLRCFQAWIDISKLNIVF